MSDRVFLIIRAPNGDVREVPLTSSGIVLGRDESADIRVDDKKVSRRHATFKLIRGEPYVEDLGSSNGVRLNGERVEGKARIDVGDKVRVGGFFVSVKPPAEGTGASVSDPRPVDPASVPPRGPSLDDDVGQTRPAPKVVERVPSAPKEDLPRLLGLDGPAAGRTFPLHRGENIVGRLEECDVPLLDGSVSRQHARLVFARDRVTVTDLGSSNGIFVNEVRVDMAELAEGDHLKIGSVSFEVRLPRPIAGRHTGPLQTRARPSASAKPRRRWVALGLAGLVTAAAVVAGAVYVKLHGGGEGPKGGRLLALADPEPDAGASALDAALAAAAPDAGATVETPPPEAPPPEAPPPSAPAPPVAKAPAAPAPPAAKAPRADLLTRTATSPFSRRAPDGLPLGLPRVDASFDFDAWVAETLSAAKACEESRDYSCLTAQLEILATRDPVNPEADALQARVEVYRKAKRTLAVADQHVARGEFSEAFALLEQVPETAPQAEDAKARAKKLQALAIEDALERAKKDSRRRRTWRRAHRRYREVLELDSENADAIEGLRAVEKNMRRRRIEFAPYAPPKGGQKAPDLKAINARILRHYGGDEALAEIAQAYARGAIKKAGRRAKRLARRGRGATRRRAAQMSRLLTDAKKRYDRTRTEISNDPDRAWSMLMQLEKREGELLPEGVPSFLTRELSVNLSEAFAQRGASMFDRGREEEAFQGWVSGYKLDPTNPKVRAGLARLERRAQTLAQEAELATQRGDPVACDRWKTITRITRADEDLHKKARERALALCR